MGETSEYCTEQSRYESRCSFCNSPMDVNETVYEMPKVGPVMLVTLKCPSCGFRHSEVIPLAVKNHRRLYFRVEGREGLYAKVIRGPRASIVIPELGVEISPGAAASLTVTNVEGIVQKILDVVERAKILGEEVDETVVEKIKRAAEEGGITLIVDDPWGVSAIEPPEKYDGKVIIEEVGGESG